MDYVSNVVDCSRVITTNFNILASGTGTGKTFWVANDIQKEFPNVKNHEILFVTSRAMIVEQQRKSENITKYNPKNLFYLNHWNGINDWEKILKKKGIPIMTYDKIIHILKSENNEGLVTLQNVKIIIFDECHTLFSDSFIKDMECLKVWIRDNLYLGKKIIIGMTATPNIVEYYQDEWGVKITRLNDKILVNYKAKQLHCTDFDTIPYIIATQIVGKTIVMCYSIADCYKLKDKIPNSAILVSKSSNKYLPEMDLIRNCIINNEVLPDIYWDVIKRDAKTKKPIEYEEKNLEVLLTTSTLREGINLRESSGVRNVICCFSDELHIVQFAGRLRYSYDNLIIADTYIRTDNYNKRSYIGECREQFKEYMKSKKHIKWFDTISHIIDHDVYKTIRFILGAEEKKFIDYINTKWLVPEDIKHEDMEKYKIYKDEDKQEIVNKVIEYKLLGLNKSKITFNMVINMLVNTLGYAIENSRFVLRKKKYTYKLIVDFDEDKIVYTPPESKYDMD